MNLFLRHAVFAVIVAIGLVAHAYAGHPYAIFGADNRHEVYEAKDPAYRILAESVVAIMDAKAISTNTHGYLKITSPTYGDDYQLCMSEPFYHQPDVAWCSGFLVADNIIATAGHCVEDKNFCKDSKFVFDYMYESKTHDPLTVEQDDVYGCKQVLDEKYNSDGIDFALVELDRPVVGRHPLPIAKSKPNVGESVFIIGNPIGLPTKIADGASVLSYGAGYFIADLDAYSGNSGAAVFNQNYEVAGILVRGEDDFVRRGSCYVSNTCSTGECGGEDVTNPEVITKALARHLAQKSLKTRLKSL